MKYPHEEPQDFVKVMHDAAEKKRLEGIHDVHKKHHVKHAETVPDVLEFLKQQKENQNDAQ